ncbi:MAG: hypothetical protein U9N40_00650 [Euryarchaeota archaeon]|nr:hypothetical protein [Euryarchaeota archaeon]
MKKSENNDLLQNESPTSHLTILDRNGQSVIQYNLPDDENLNAKERRILNELILCQAIRPRITVVGMGEYSNALITRLFQMEIKFLETMAIDTDRMRLEVFRAGRRLLIASSVTNGKDPGKNPTIAENGIKKSKLTFHRILASKDLVILVAAIEDAVGFGSAPVLAELLRGWGVPVLAMIINPESNEKLLTYDLEKVCAFYDNFDATVTIDSRTAFQGFNLSKEAIQSFIQEVVTEFLKYLTKALFRIDEDHIGKEIIFSDLYSLLKSEGFGGLAFAEDVPEKVAEKCFRYWLSDVDITKFSGGIIHIVAGEAFTNKDAENLVKSFSEIIGHELNFVYSLRCDKEYESCVRVVAVFNGINLSGSVHSSP